MTGIAPDLAGLAVEIGRLDPLDGNPRRGDVDAVARSYGEFGQRKPIVARRVAETGRGEVIAGNTQLAAARSLGWPEIAVVWVDDDELRGAAFALADNHTAELGSYDRVALAEMIGLVAAEPGLLAATAYTADDLARLGVPTFAPIDDEQARLDQLTPDVVTCPSCGHSWDRRDPD